jgi:dephospho-CoA kinase
MKYAIALTGSISTGKSTVSSMLKLYGYEGIDADKIAHKILDQEQKSIKKLFGSEYINGNCVNRKKLGQLIFSNIDEKKRLENFLHPKIKEDILNQSYVLDKKQFKYFIDLPLFFEKNNSYNFNDHVLIYTSFDIQLKRLIKRLKFFLYASHYFKSGAIC